MLALGVRSGPKICSTFRDTFRDELPPKLPGAGLLLPATPFHALRVEAAKGKLNNREAFSER
jgi:hypothetical protein